jgi:hypothetical protein
MLYCEKELDIDNKLHHYLKITGILNNVFRPQKTCSGHKKMCSGHTKILRKQE